MILVGIGQNNWSQNVPKDLFRACEELGLSARILDFNSLTESDLSGVTHLTPALFVFQPLAVEIYRKAEISGVLAINPIKSVLIADDKIKTYYSLKASKIVQIESEIIELNYTEMLAYFQDHPSGVVFKMAHGGQGRWVRWVSDASQITAVLEEFSEEGPGPIIAQPFIHESMGESVRAIVIKGEVIAASIRRSKVDWRSNITLGGQQTKYELTEFEKNLAISAAQAIGLGVAGVDLIRTKSGSKVLEVNACPDFTSMKEVSEEDIAKKVITELINTKVH